MSGIGALMKETPEDSLTPDTKRGGHERWPAVNQEAGSHQDTESAGP